MRTPARLTGVLAACLVVLLGCSSTNDSDVTSSASTSSDASTTSSPSVSPNPSPPSTPTQVLPPPAAETPSEAVTFVCGDPTLYQSGTAIYSDGTTGYEPSCDTYIPPTGSQDRNGDGVISGFERCGTRCGEEPTSGEIQARYGCEQGYITGPICDELGVPQG